MQVERLRVFINPVKLVGEMTGTTDVDPVPFFAVLVHGIVGLAVPVAPGLVGRELVAQSPSLDSVIVHLVCSCGSTQLGEGLLRVLFSLCGMS